MSEENGFIDWQGGPCPVDVDTFVDVKFAGGGAAVSKLAGSFNWQRINVGGNIIAYRVIDAPKTQTARDTQVGGDHYKKAGIQPWDVVDTWPIDQQIGFHRGNALKYVMLMGTKDENLREIRKATHYLQKLAEVLEQKGGV